METIFEFSPWIVGTIPVVVGLVQVVKLLGVPSKFAPAFSLLFGVLALSLTGIPWQAVVVQGVIAGLAASGLWSGGKSTLSE